MPNPQNPRAFPGTYWVKMTRKRALELGIVRCEHCGYPPNNHFDFPPYRCAHARCPGYKEIVR